MFHLSVVKPNLSSINLPSNTVYGESHSFYVSVINFMAPLDICNITRMHQTLAGKSFPGPFTVVQQNLRVSFTTLFLCQIAAECQSTMRLGSVRIFWNCTKVNGFENLSPIRSVVVKYSTRVMPSFNKYRPKWYLVSICPLRFSLASSFTILRDPWLSTLICRADGSIHLLTRENSSPSQTPSWADNEMEGILHPLYNL